SARALPFARTVAHQWRGRMVLVHATAHPGDRDSCAVEGELTDLVDALSREGIEADTVLRAAPAAQAIVAVAPEQYADLIVMASPSALWPEQVAERQRH